MQLILYKTTCESDCPILHAHQTTDDTSQNGKKPRPRAKISISFLRISSKSEISVSRPNKQHTTSLRSRFTPHYHIQDNYYYCY